MHAAVRIPLILLVVLFVNLLIFSAMQYMVANPRMRLTEPTNINVANFIRVAEQSRAVKSRRDPKAPKKPANDMQQSMQQLAATSGSGAISDLQVEVPELRVDLNVDVGGDIQVARELTPLVRIPPEYPRKAIAERVEGYVVLRFTVTETGSVDDPEVLRAEPAGFFERAALSSVKRWKYQPQIRNGEPTRVVTMTRLTFVLPELHQEPVS